MEFRIEKIEPKYLIGMNMTMSLSDNKTPELWQNFMPRRSEVIGRKNNDFISMQVYDKHEKNLFSPSTLFTKWAVVEVNDGAKVADGMESYYLVGGLYVVFIHNGTVTEFPKTMKCIFESWFPQSEYELDNREHFEVLPETYQPMDPNAREEVWLPIKAKL
jgi:AraC family transcriptional regulator